MSVSESRYFYPNAMGRIFFRAMEEIIGRNGVGLILGLAGWPGYASDYPPNDLTRTVPFDAVSNSMQALENYYGPHGGRGIALRVGRASFHYGLAEFGPSAGLTDLAFRLLPFRAKLGTGAAALAGIFNGYSDQRVRVSEDAQSLYWHIDRCPVCWGRQTEHPVCHLAVGVLQEALYWVSGGKFFNVEETHCIARGDAACTIEIKKTPLS